MIGITSNASLLYSIGHGACYFLRNQKTAIANQPLVIFAEVLNYQGESNR
ncbi:hypothetical protein IQ218_17780 [Synechocystis salina LEGE 06099]|nr:hypothetical protein [Synechocystis salina LEGE 06099]